MTLEDVVADVLTDKPQPVAVIVKGVGDRAGIAVARPTVSGALFRLLAKSRAGYVDDPGHPRRWFAVPGA